MFVFSSLFFHSFCFSVFCSAFHFLFFSLFCFIFPLSLTLYLSQTSLYSPVSLFLYFPFSCIITHHPHFFLCSPLLHFIFQISLHFVSLFTSQLLLLFFFLFLSFHHLFYSFLLSFSLSVLLFFYFSPLILSSPLHFIFPLIVANI